MQKCVSFYSETAAFPEAALGISAFISLVRSGSHDQRLQETWEVNSLAEPSMAPQKSWIPFSEEEKNGH